MIKICKKQDYKIKSAQIEERNLKIEQIVSDIISDVIENQDQALFKYGEMFDKAKLESLQVSEEEIEIAIQTTEKRTIEVIERAIENIKKFHQKQVRNSYMLNEDGVILGQRISAIEKVGLYVPGGTASYPSSVLMNCVPAKIAGCNEIYMVTPPNADGSINKEILVAAKMSGVDKIFKIGGAGAIAALAYGTQTVPKVDKIVGPGNAFVAQAKKQVFGKVSIDMIAGPSEILIVADETSNAKVIACDLLSQAEHDKMASAILITTSEAFAEKVREEVEIEVEKLLRKDIARVSIDDNGMIILVDTIDEAIEIANEIAPEHFELCIDNAFDYFSKVKHAGSVFLGKNCPEALGDYMAGPNHTLPTSGTARFSSALSVDDFIKKTQFIYYTDDALREVYEDVAYFAEKEGLTAHARSARVRMEETD